MVRALFGKRGCNVYKYATFFKKCKEIAEGFKVYSEFLKKKTERTLKYLIYVMQRGKILFDNRVRRNLCNIRETKFNMTGDYLLEKLLDTFQNSYDVERTCDINGDIYDAYASFRAVSAKYVLVKKAELWSAKCFEHVFFRLKKETLEKQDVERFRRQLETYIEPELVRRGERWPQENHMYTYITGIFICEEGVTEEAVKLLRAFRYVKNYKFTIRGYSEARLLVFDLKRRRLFGNRAAKELVKGYKKSGIF